MEQNKAALSSARRRLSDSISKRPDPSQTPPQTTLRVQQVHVKLAPQSNVFPSTPTLIAHTKTRSLTQTPAEKSPQKSLQSLTSSLPASRSHSESKNGAQDDPKAVVKAQIEKLKELRKHAQVAAKDDQSHEAPIAINADVIKPLQCQRRSSEGQEGGKSTPINTMAESVSAKTDQSPSSSAALKRDVDGKAKNALATRNGSEGSQEKVDSTKGVEPAAKRSKFEESLQSVTPTGPKRAFSHPKPFDSSLRKLNNSHVDLTLKRHPSNGNTPPRAGHQPNGKISKLSLPRDHFESITVDGKTVRPKLHDFQPLLKHVHMVHCGKHENGFWTCRWDGCHYGTEDGV